MSRHLGVWGVGSRLISAFLHSRVNQSYGSIQHMSIFGVGLEKNLLRCVSTFQGHAVFRLQNERDIPETAGLTV